MDPGACVSHPTSSTGDHVVLKQPSLFHVFSLLRLEQCLFTISVFHVPLRAFGRGSVRVDRVGVQTRLHTDNGPATMSLLHLR